MAEACKTCHGEGQIPVERTLQIKIPAGVDTGSQLRIGGEGEPGPQAGPPGDLYVVLRVAEHAFFKRDGTQLFCEVPVSVPQAALGATIEVPTLDGGKTKIAVPEGTQSGTVLRVKSQGVPALGGKGRGDLHVLVRVVVPKHLTAEQRKLFEQLAKTLPGARPQGQGQVAPREDEGPPRLRPGSPGMRAFRVTVAAEDEDLATVALWEAGTAGIEVRGGPTGRVDLLAYFEDDVLPPTPLLPPGANGRARRGPERGLGGALPRRLPRLSRGALHRDAALGRTRRALPRRG